MGGEYRRGSGSNALPQGGASQVNRSQPAQDDLNDPSIAEVPVEYAPGEDDPIEDDDSHDSESMQVLLQGPDPNYRTALLPPKRTGRVPKYVVRNLPQLQAAARSPDATPALRAMYNAVIRQLEIERRSGGA